MIRTQSYLDFVPQFVSQKMNGKLSYKIRIKSEYTRSDGTCALYLDISLDGDRKKPPLNISVPEKYFDKQKQRVKRGYKFSKDYNILIEKMLADINAIEVNYRLSGETMTLKKVMEDLNKPSLRVDFNIFATNYLEATKDSIKESTYRQQKGALSKIKRFRSPLFFSDIDEDFIDEFVGWLKTHEKNSDPTIQGTLKNFKKYLHAANKRGIQTKLDYSDITVKSMKGDFTFLTPDEVKSLYEFYSNKYINPTWKNILQRYLFSCFTGLRISDIEHITHDNVVGDTLVFTMAKTNKFIRIKLNNTAKSLIGKTTFFCGDYTREYINRELKLISKAVGIKKRVYYHSSRHTFATNYLISGGKVENLQKLLGHSEIKTTMIYVHTVQSVMNEEVRLMDSIIKSPTPNPFPNNPEKP